MITRRLAYLPGALLVLGLVAPVARGQAIVQSWQVQPLSAAFVGGIAFDPIFNGNSPTPPGVGSIWTVDETNDLIQQWDRSGSLLNTLKVTGASLSVNDPQPIGATIEPVTGTLWVCDENKLVYEVTGKNGAGEATIGRKFTTLPAVIDPSAIAMDPVSNTLWVADDGAQLLVEFSLTGTVGRTINITAAGGTDADGLAYNQATRTFYIGNDATDEIIEIDRTGKKLNAWSLSGIGVSPEDIAVDTISGSLFVGDGFFTRKVYEISGIVPPCAGVVAPHGYYGLGCKDSGNTEPALVISDCPAVNGSFTIGVLTSKTLTVPATILLGTTQTKVNLGFFGAPQCDVNVVPVLVLPPLTLVQGRAGLKLKVPDNPTLSGAILDLQLLLYPDNGAVGKVAMSKGLQLQIQ